MTSKSVLILALVGSSALFGCKSEPQEVILGDDAPVFGVAADQKTFSQFVVGKWQIEYITMGQAERASDIYNFKADGTFTFVRTQFTFAGRWKETPNGINLEYTTLEGAPLQKKLDEFRETASSGRQGDIKNDLFSEWASKNLEKMRDLKLSEDKKMFQFSSEEKAAATPDPNAAPGMPDAMGSMMNNMFQANLMRFGIKK